MIPKDRNINIAEQTRLSPGLRWHETRFCLSQFLKSLQDCWLRCCESFWHFLIERKICTAKTLLNGSMAWFFQNIRDAWLPWENKMHKTAAEMRLESSHRFTDAIYKMMAFFWTCLKKTAEKLFHFWPRVTLCIARGLQRMEVTLKKQTENWWDFFGCILNERCDLR